MSILATVSRFAGQLMAKSTWTRYPMSLRLIAALGCWTLGIGTAVGVFAVLKLLEPAAWVAIGAVATWFALMLAAYVLNSLGLMVVALWSALVLTLLSIPVGIALAE